MAQILFTGSSSFTGYWFVRALREAGHDVCATFRGGRDSYAGVRGERVERLGCIADTVFDCAFGTDRFVALVRESRAAVLCHHAADVVDYRSPSFDPLRALASNTGMIAGLVAVLEAGCARILLTGSMFEAGEGAGDDELRAFSPYGLSKTLTAECFKYYTATRQIPLAKFVIPNPFGPFEEGRFSTYLACTWLAGDIVQVRTPQYVRDNIHVSALAREYAATVGRQWPSGFHKINPSGYRESNAQFTQRCARELGSRWGQPCASTFADQVDWTEPAVRVNTDSITLSDQQECAAWDELADYYQTAMAVDRTVGRRCVAVADRV